MRALVILAILATPSIAAADNDAAAIRRAIRRELPRIHACFEQAGMPEGRAIVRFTIRVNGRVAKAVGSGLPAVHDCYARVIKTVRFPKRATPVEVTYPFVIDHTGG